MGVPKRKASKSRKRLRRAHDALRAPTLVECDHCHELKRAHAVCPTCGWHNGREVVPPPAPTPSESGR